ncbi:uncharacterized protein F4817DRAFT_316417 [Daldinia loculata]|uniref:uncharacterized protein n=1 Tax=Daldinia loculata TaxID=103429 RepID=UPI0020C517CA|nr:uncharacterized protein F4817DRAFT_316417 [Daldinia loculata]KAI1646701.1 hypothetical protein F4817DRAFT_316417 [Daldinia loculata]
MTWLCGIFALLIGLAVYHFNRARTLFGIRIVSTRTSSDNVPETRHKYVDDNEKLASLLRESNKHVTVFISIDVHAWELDRTKITDIGMSAWYSGGNDDNVVLSRHWQIEENKLLKDRYMLNDPDIFTFGKTELISESQIAQKIDYIFESLGAGCQRTVIVGHGIRSTLDLLEKFWEPPGSEVIILDTQIIWQLQNHQSNKVTLETALISASDLSYNVHFLHNTGNNARFILNLLQEQGAMSKRF